MDKALERYRKKIKFNQSSESKAAVSVLQQLASRGEAGEADLLVGIKYYLGLDNKRPTGAVAGQPLKRGSSLYNYLRSEFQEWDGGTQWTPDMEAHREVDMDDFF